jgi:hypothetical protein
LGQKQLPKQTQKMFQILLSYIAKNDFKTLPVTKKKLLKAIVTLQNQINSPMVFLFKIKKN